MQLPAGWGAGGVAAVVAAACLLHGLRLLQPIQAIRSIQPTQDNRETAGAVGPDGVAAR